MTNCRRCETLAPPDTRFCGTCGAALVPVPDTAGARKHVVVCFVDIVGSTALGERLDPESLRGYLRRYFDTVSAVLVRHGGSVEKFIGDAVMAVFGVPVAREDDAARALLAAAELHQAVAGISASLEREYGIELRVRIGVNGGEVFVSQHADGQISVTGDAVNTAARLEQAAGPSQTLVGGTIPALAGPRARLVPAPPVRARGKAEPVPAWTLEDAETAVTQTADVPLVGRDSELADLNRIVSRVALHDESWLVTVLGVAGIGKSRLVTEFLAAIEGQYVVLEGQCPSFSSGGTFWPLMEVLGQLADDWRARVTRLFGDGPEGAQVVERLATAVGDSARQTGLPDIVWATRRLIEELSCDKPVVLVWEDLQWAEPMFLEFLDLLASRLTSVPVLMLCVSRPELLSSSPAWGGGRGGVMTMELSPLDTDAVRYLAEQLSPEVVGHGGPGDGPGAGVLTADAIDLGPLQAACEGNPLILQKMLEVPSAGPYLPVAVQTLFEAQLDRLAPADRLLCQSAAAIGREFWSDAACFAADGGGASDPAWQESLDRLLRMGVLQPTRARNCGRPAHRFTQTLLMETVYRATSKRERSRLHASVAQWLESAPHLGDGERAELIAFHLERAHALLTELAPDGQQARDFAQRAAGAALSASRQCLARSDLRSASRMLSQAQRLLPRGDQRHYEIVRELFHLRIALGDLEEATAIVDAATDALGGEPLWDLLQPVARAAAEMRRDPVTRHAAAQVADRAIEGLATRSEPSALIWAYELAAQARVADGRLAEAERIVRAALDCARASGDEQAERRLLCGLCELAFWGPTPAGEGWALCESLLPLVKSDMQLTAPVLAIMATLAAMMGRLESAAELIASARQITLDFDLPGIRVLLSQYHGLVLLLTGQPAEAAAELLAAARTFPPGQAAALAFAALSARTALIAGDRDAAAAAMQWRPGETQPPDSSSDPHYLRLWYGTAARLAALDHREGLARIWAATAVRIAGAADSPGSCADALVDLAWILSYGGDEQAAQRELAAAQRQFARKGATRCAELAPAWASAAGPREGTAR
jgi:class 3 adenylate cyclase